MITRLTTTLGEYNYTSSSFSTTVAGQKEDRVPVSSHSISHSTVAFLEVDDSATLFPPFFFALVALLPADFLFSILVMTVSKDRKVGFTVDDQLVSQCGESWTKTYFDTLAARRIF